MFAKSLAVAGAASTMCAGAAFADFDGPYAPANWTTTDNAGGSATFNGTASLDMLSGDIGVGGDTTVTINAPSGGNMSFDWSYTSSDSGDFDQGGYINAGVFVFLAQNDTPGSGSVSVNVDAGDQIGFYVTTLDGAFGPGHLTITNFSGPAGGGKNELCSVDVWDGALSVFSWGDPNTATYGQTFTAIDNAVKSFSFYVNDIEGTPVVFSAHIYAWDGAKATGSPIFSSGALSTDGIGGAFEEIKINTPGASVTPGNEYVAFLSCSDYFPTGGGASWGNSGSDVFPGTFVFLNNGADFGALFTTNWSQDFNGPGVDLATCITFGTAVTPGSNAYFMDSGSPPWGSVNYANAMDAVFGPGNWQSASYADDASVILNDAGFLYLEGGDSSANELNAWLGANGSDLEAWVAAGGNLYLNAAPNEGGNINFGFNVSLNYPDFGNEAHAINGAHPIFNGPFNPVVTDYTGNSFAHSTVSGAGTVPVMVNENGLTVLGEAPFNGSGNAMFGGITSPQFHTPAAEAQNLLQNILAYVSGEGADCVGDCNGDGALNILDFVCFQGEWQNQTDKGDCDGNGLYNILDFVCFQGEWQAGCP
jgi:hypothetical protein